jgi:hypothetical protein
LRLEGVGQGSSPWVDVLGGIVLVLLMLSVVEIAYVRKDRVLMDEKAHQWKVFGLSLLLDTPTAFANITCGMLFPSIWGHSQAGPVLCVNNNGS